MPNQRVEATLAIRHMAQKFLAFPHSLQPYLHSLLTPYPIQTPTIEQNQTGKKIMKITAMHIKVRKETNENNTTTTNGIAQNPQTMCPIKEWKLA